MIQDSFSEYSSFTSGNLDWAIENFSENPKLQPEITEFLQSCDLELDGNLADFVTVREGKRLVACAGMGENVIKCVAVSPALRGQNITLRLISDVTNLAADMGRYQLFLYTKPENVDTFSSCGFYPLVEMPGVIALMENSPVGLTRYCKSLATQRHSGDKIGSIVMNANPFTFGHQFLAQQAANECDWLHVFVVGENSSLITYEDRYALVCEGLKHMPRITVHPGSIYMISKATFPSYFLKDRGIVDQCHTALDLIIFREHVAPALGITHRFVGTEPFCPVTRKYNEDMKHWLMHAPSKAPVVTVVELERKQQSNRAISASEVRRCLRADDFSQMTNLVPQATIDLLRAKYFDPGARVATGTG
ncbi:[citrate (pro-3S)-lyase] ligase [Rhodoferax sp.]|uniref:[citrate (pro-3S)-lyase] ligase n=1 Tax=Rhodoferax sp. TaxID=50421 RepID=UPI00283CB401|nr:[citrate (pro-3S)-lyase] ligase [Rhodoferax sp.]MDR3371691.1 [citrate (pro-3S)-lyase] ligase [Rhodoferax sp.]